MINFGFEVGNWSHSPRPEVPARGVSDRPAKSEIIYGAVIFAAGVPAVFRGSVTIRHCEEGYKSRGALDSLI